MKKSHFGGSRFNQMMGSSNDALSSLDAIQIDVPATVRNSREKRLKFAESLGGAIIKFFNHFY